MFKFELGQQVTDSVSGFAGTVVSRTEYLLGVNRYGVQARVSPDGTLRDPGWFDEQRLVAPV